MEQKLNQLKEDKKELLVEIHKNEYQESMWRLDQKKNQKKIKKMGGVLTKQHAKLSTLNKLCSVESGVQLQLLSSF